LAVGKLTLENRVIDLLQAAVSRHNTSFLRS
jgi:hypothetical protein